MNDDLLAGNFDFLDSLDDSAWRDFLAVTGFPDISDALADGTFLMDDDAPANDVSPNDHNAMTNGHLPTDGNALESEDDLLQDASAPLDGEFPSEWERLLTDYNDLETSHLTGNDSPLWDVNVTGNYDDAVVNGDQVMTDDDVPETPSSPANNNSLGDGFSNLMNYPSSTDSTNGNSRVDGNPLAESPVPASNLHPADSPLPVGNASSIESLFSGDTAQSADSPHQVHTPEVAVQESIEQLCHQVPFPTPTYAESQKCIIRPYHIRDAIALQRHANNFLISKWFSYRFPHPYTDNDARHWILNQPRIITPFTELETRHPTFHQDGSVDVPWENTLNFVIASCQQDERNALLSGIGVRPGSNIWNRSAELSFWIAEPWWGRGIATSAVGIFLKTLFLRTLGLERVTAYTLTRWTISGFQGQFGAEMVLVKNKFKCEGCLTKSVFKFGDWWDQHVWGILRENVMVDEPNMPEAMSGGLVR